MLAAGGMAEDPDSIVEFSEYEVSKDKLFVDLVSEMIEVDAYTKTVLQHLCKHDVQNTPQQCRKEYLGQLACLQRRLRKTTNAFRGGQYFRDDLDHLQHVYEAIKNAGVGNIFSLDVSTPKKKRKIETADSFPTTSTILPNRRSTRRSGK